MQRWSIVCWRDNPPRYVRLKWILLSRLKRQLADLSPPSASQHNPHRLGLHLHSQGFSYMEWLAISHRLEGGDNECVHSPQNEGEGVWHLPLVFHTGHQQGQQVEGEEDAQAEQHAHHIGVSCGETCTHERSDPASDSWKPSDSCNHHMSGRRRSSGL